MSLTHIFVDVCSTLSVLLAIYCSVPYWQAILKGKTKPHQFTWIVFAIMNGIAGLSQFLAGARASVLLYMAFFLSNLVTIALSFKYGVRSTSRYDKLLFTFALLTIVAWVLTKNNAVAIWLTVLIDIFATTLNVLKIRALPDSEDPLAWNIATVAYVFSCLSLAQTHFGVLYVRPIYGLLSDLTIIAAIYYFRSLDRRRK